MSATATDDRFWSKVDGAEPLGFVLVLLPAMVSDVRGWGR